MGAVLLAAGVVALLIAVAQGPTWGWGAWRVIAAGGVSVLALPGWTAWELHTRAPLVELRMLRQRSVLAGNLTGVLVALGFYPFMSLVVRFVQTPPSAGYGFGASTVLAGMMLTPFSAASFAARRPAIALARRTSPAWAIAASSLIIAAGQLLFLLTRSGYPSVIAAMTLTGRRRSGIRDQPNPDRRRRPHPAHGQRDQLLPAPANGRLLARQRPQRHRPDRTYPPRPAPATRQRIQRRAPGRPCDPRRRAAHQQPARPPTATPDRATGLARCACRQLIISVLAAGRRGRTAARSF